MTATLKPRTRSVNRAFDPRAAKEAFERKAGSCGVDLLSAFGVILADGLFHEVKTHAGKVWYIFHEEFGSAWGGFGNWTTGVECGWSSRSGRGSHMTRREAERIGEIHKNSDKERNEWARKQAKHVLWWNQEAPSSHSYLRRKQIGAHGARLFRGHRVLSDLNVHGALAVPVYDDDEELQGIQFICANGDKRNLGPTGGGHYWIGEPDSFSQQLYIAEGFATAASVFEDTERPCCVAFGHGGFMRVAQYVRKRFHPKRLTIVADGDDVSSKSANAAARAFKGLVFVADPGTDYNDMLLKERARERDES